MNDTKLSKVVFNNKAVLSIYLGTKLLWEAINSCFGKGYWINNKTWSNTDKWRNNN
jgi:hypothetical protein